MKMTILLIMANVLLFFLVINFQGCYKVLFALLAR